MIEDHLSSRGLRAAESIPRVDLDVYFEATQNLYDPLENPNGALVLNMAENKLCWDLMRSKIKEVAADREIPDWVPGYTSARGDWRFRESVAAFLKDYLTGVDLDPECIAISAGASAVIENTTFLLCEEGDVVAFPAPSYPVYRQDISTYSCLERYNIVTHHHLQEIEDRPVLVHGDLEKSWEQIQSQGKRMRMLVLTHPDNPTGRIYRYEDLSWIADWCIEREIHLVVNEIYGLSLLNVDHPAVKEEYAKVASFQSFAPIICDRKSPYLHLWYAFSKDFGISGLRLGLLYTENITLLRAYGNANLGKMASNHTQWLVKNILDDRGFLENYISINQQRLTDAYALVKNTMSILQIPYVPSRGSLFIWIDLSEFLDAPSKDAENAFWMTLYRTTGILLTPGDGFGHSKHGQFRVVCTYLSLDHLSVAMEKFKTFIHDLRDQN